MAPILTVSGIFSCDSGGALSDQESPRTVHARGWCLGLQFWKTKNISPIVT